MSQSGKLMPNLDQNTTKILNLTVLQRMDPNIEEILITAAHVTFYAFNVDSSQWSRKDVEGSLFVVKRNAQPRFQFIVMNRRSTENLVENLLGDFEYEIQIPYLLYRNALQEVNGIWFYNSRECEEVANLFNRILSAYSKVPTKPKVPSSKSDFEELEAVPSMSIMEEPLEPSSTVPTSDTAEDSSFMNFFTAALNVGNSNANVPIPREHQHQQQPSPTIPLLPNAINVPSLANSEVPSFQMPSSLNLMTRTDSSDPIGNKTLMNNLLKPSFFIPTPSSSSSSPSPSPLMMPPIPSAVPVAALHPPPLNLQRRPYGTPLLQPFPPPNPSPSLAHNPSAPSPTPIITRDEIREALLKLVQEDQFIDMFYQALQKVQNK